MSGGLRVNTIFLVWNLKFWFILFRYGRMLKHGRFLKILFYDFANWYKCMFAICHDVWHLARFKLGQLVVLIKTHLLQLGAGELAPSTTYRYELTLSFCIGITNWNLFWNDKKCIIRLDGNPTKVSSSWERLAVVINSFITAFMWHEKNRTLVFAKGCRNHLNYIFIMSPYVKNTE